VIGGHSSRGRKDKISIMNKKSIRYFLGFAAVSSLFLTAARADVLDYSVSYGTPSAPLIATFSGTYTLPTFNTSLGTLTGVSLTLNSFDVVSGEVFNPIGSAQSYTAESATLPVMVTALDGLTATATGSASYGAGIANAGPFVITILPGQASAPNASASLSSGFSDYEGIAGQMFNLTVASEAGSYSIQNAGSLGGGGGGTSYGTVQVEYDFTPSPTPEPSTMALAGFGGLATLLVFRRRNQTV
jgi:hypothetical protein